MHASLTVLLAVTLPAIAAPAQATVLQNGDAEAGTLAGWTDPISGGFNLSTATVNNGLYAFWPGVTGPSGGAHNNELRQDVGVAALAAAIDAGAVTSTFSGYGRSNSVPGASDLGRVVLEFLDAGASAIATFDTGTIQPFNAWQPFGDVRTVPAGTRTLRVRLLGSRQVGVSTDCFFDDLVLGLHEWQVTGSGCAGASGVPSLTLASPPWLGGTYGLSVANLAGGLAFMVTGLAGQSLPLQPFGLGFGPGCTLQVSADAVLFLVQAGGAATWSLSLPNDPAFAGLSIHNQVLELTAQSAVSDAVRAGLR